LKIGNIGSLKWGKKNSTNSCLRLHIYLHTNNILIHKSLYVFDNWVKNLSHKNVWYSYSKEMLTGKTKPIRIIGVPDNQLLD
jgi:hypothetical protein